MTHPSLSDILRATADRYGVSVEDMLSVRRYRKIAWPRQTAMYLSRTLTQRSLPQIGRFYSRDHSTVIHSMRRMSERLTADEQTREHVATIIFWLSRGRYEAKAHAAARAVADGLVIFGIYRHSFGRKALAVVRVPKPNHPNMRLIRALDATVPESVARAERFANLQRPPV